MAITIGKTGFGLLRNDDGPIADTGDFNGDGLWDVATALWQDESPNDGAIAIFSGSAAGLVSTQVLHLPRSASPSGRFFASALSIGDFNGDGFDDLAAVHYDYDAEYEYELAVWPGSATGLSAAPTIHLLP